MRHPLSTSRGGFEGSFAVAGVDVFVVVHAQAQAVPQDFEPAVAEGAQGGVVGFACGDLGVVELAGPGGAGQAAKGPLLDGFAEVAVVGQAAGDEEFAATGASGDGGAACVALQRVRRGELIPVLADLAGDPGGETITQARHAQVDLAARERLPRVGVLDGVVAAGAGGAEQQFAHAAFPGAPLGVQQQQLGGGQADGPGFGAGQFGPHRQAWRGEGGGDAVGETGRPAVLVRAGEGLQLSAGGGVQLSGSGLPWRSMVVAAAAFPDSIGSVPLGR
jgi:hypothetical protein